MSVNNPSRSQPGTRTFHCVPRLHEPEKDFRNRKVGLESCGRGTAMMGREDEFLSARARKIERALLRKNWTRVHLADLTGYDERTIRNVLHGKPVREQTVIDICEALGIEPILEAEG